MKKLIFLTLAAILAACVPMGVQAAAPAKYGFRAISSATIVKCGVFGSRQLLGKDSNGHPIQGHAPDTTYSRMYTLGTKGFANHSTFGQVSFKFTCTASGTSTTVPVKVFMDGVETYYLTTDSDTYVIGR